MDSNQNLSTLTRKEIEALIAEKEALIEQQREELKPVFEYLGITADQLDEFINDKSRFTHDAWDLMEQEREKSRKLFLQKKSSAKEKQREKIDLICRKNWIFVK